LARRLSYSEAKDIEMERRLEDSRRLEEWTRNVRSISTGHNRSSGLSKPGVYDLIEQGPFRGADPKGVIEREHLDPVSRALGLIGTAHCFLRFHFFISW
jgi:hypothetical protein